MLVDQVVPSMLQGMSQQDSRARIATHGDLQLNGVSHPAFGLGKRTGSDHVRHLPGLAASSSLFSSWVYRDENERYVFTFDGSAFRVFGLDGTEYFCTTSASASNYLRTVDPNSDIVSMTQSDTTFLLNRERVVSMGTATASAEPPKAIIWVKRGNYSQQYTVTVDASTVTYTTPDGTDNTPDDDTTNAASVEVTFARTSHIADQLRTLLAAALGVGYTVTYNSGDSWFTVSKAGNADFSVSVKDSVGNTSLGACKNQALSFDELPPIAPAGYRAKVLGGPDDIDDYWVQWSADRTNLADNSKRGVWVEVPAPGSLLQIDPSTMPHVVVRKQDDTNGTTTGTANAVYFEVKAVDWGARRCGDSTTVPPPSFVGNSVSSMFVFQGRLGFAFESSIVLSETQNIYNFWRGSATQVQDTDPIDVSVNPGRLDDDRVMNIESAFTFGEDLMLCANGAQVLIPGDTVITPASVLPKLSLAVQAYPKCRPCVCGSKAFLAATDGASSSVFDITTRGDSRLRRERLITSHIPTLIKGKPVHMTACLSESTLFVRSTDDRSKLYVYRWMETEGEERMQAAWGIWQFGGTIVSAEVLGSTLWVLIDRGEGIVLESVEIVPYVQTEETKYPLMLDRKTPVGLARMRGAFGPPSGGGSYTPPPPPGPGEPPPPPPPPPPINAVPSFATTVVGADGGDSSHQFIMDSITGEQSGNYSSSISRERALVSYDSTTGYTTISLPWSVGTKTVLFRADTSSSVPFTVVDSKTIKVLGDLTLVSMYIGDTYNFIYTFGQAHLYQQSPGGGVGARPGRVQLVRWRVGVARSGPFFMTARRLTRTSTPKLVSPRTTGSYSDPVVADHDGYVLVMANAKDVRVSVESSFFTPLWLISSSWRCEYVADVLST